VTQFVTVRDTVHDTVRDTFHDTVRDTVCDSSRQFMTVRDSSWHSLRHSSDTVRDTVHDTILGTIWTMECKCAEFNKYINVFSSTFSSKAILIADLKQLRAVN